MTNFFAFLVTSSADPEKTALSIKGILVLLVPILSAFLGIDSTLSDTIVGSAVDLITNLLTLVGILMTLWGLIRKVRLGRWAHPLA